ncbi:MAG: hypothetical protein MZW92_75000 [Comamonadaceae bacterium]|nr:hypothetical protein [Comamonadaceae bacterium]
MALLLRRSNSTKGLSVTMIHRSLPPVLLISCLALASCGGGGGDDDEPPTSDDPKVQAAIDTVTSNPACSSDELGSYYWEIGDADGRVASGRVGGDAPTADTLMEVASASKWIYAAYVAQRRDGALRDDADLPFLNFTSGYTGFPLPSCGGADTVGECVDGNLGDLNPDHVGKFAYNSGHMQHHAAVVMNLGELDRDALADEVGGTLGIDLDYESVQIAAGARTTPANYAAFLRRIVGGQLEIGRLLGQGAVCASETGCEAGTVVSPPQREQVWHYSLGHWVEDDAATVAAQNVAYSSAGAFGFYPWVTTGGTPLYGIVARERKLSAEQEGFKSAICGAAIRRAYVTGQVQAGG